MRNGVEEEGLEGGGGRRRGGKKAMGGGEVRERGTRATRTMMKMRDRSSREEGKRGREDRGRSKGVARRDGG